MPNDKMDKDERRAKILAELKASKQKRIDNPNLHNQLKELDNFLREYGSIEALWKNVEKKKNDTKTQLRKAEKELVDATIALEDVVGKLDEGDKKKSYKELIEGAYGNGNEKHAKKFIEKFPNWSIAIGKMFSESPHFQRIFQASATTRNFKDIHRESNFELKRTGKGKIQGDGILSKIKSGWKSLKTAFSNYIKPDDIGKASKSSLARRIKKFGEEINRPWRMWWDFAAAGDAKLSKDDAKKRFKEKLKTNDPVQVAEFFNHGPSESGGEHEYAIVADKSNDYTQCKGFSYMNMVVEDLDKNLLKDVAAVFDVNTKDIENNIANRDKITASNIFQDKDRKPEDYEKFFSILEIKDYYDNEHNDEIVTKISELLKEIEGEEKLSKLAGTENANIIKFLKSAQISYVIKNNKMKEKSEIIANLESIRKIIELSSAGAVDDNNLLNEKDSGLGGNTKKIIDEIEDNWDKEIAKKFKDAIDILLKPTEQQLKNIKAISDKLVGLPDVTGTPQKFTTKKQVAQAIGVIEDCQALTDESHNEGCTYDPKNGRKVFLVDLAVRFGVHGITTGNIQDLCKSKVDLQPPYDNNTGAKLVQRIRNIIGHGLGYGTHNMGVVLPGMKNPNSLPDIKDKNIVEKICEELKIDEKKN